MVSCCVRSCKTSRKMSNVSFHKFPSDKIRRMQWLTSLKINAAYLQQNNELRVCSKHFLQSDFIFGGYRKKLKNAAVPKLDPSDALPKLQEKREAEEIQNLKNCIKSMELEMHFLRKNNERVYDLRPFTFNAMKNNDQTLYYTGFQTYKIMVAVFNFVLPSGNIHLLHLNLKSQNVIKHSCSMHSEQQFLLTMVRLRRAYSFETLSNLFSVPEAMAVKIFRCWISLMFLRFTHLNTWPHRNVIIENAPQHCRQNFKKVIGSIDSIQFYIEKPKTKSTNSKTTKDATVKSLIMVDPSGTIIYMSPLYIGWIDDETLVRKSGFLSSLKDKLRFGEIYPDDVILADKSFKLHTLLENLDIQTLQFTKTERQSGTETVRNVTHERVQVERAIRRLKEYKILREPISTGMLNTTYQMYVICCVLCLFRNKLRT